MASLMSPTNLGADFVEKSRLHDYTWIFAVDIIFAFLAAYGIGANDVANAFGTSVAAKAITMRQALFIAAIFEFTGAFFLGSAVTNTISGGIAKGSEFMRDPELLMYGMMCVDLAVAIWLWLATYLELPVSTTHSCVGGVLGMALVLKGSNAIYWNRSIDEFPYIAGFSAIALSWVTSPILSGLAAALIFFLVRLVCLRSHHAFDRSFLVLPFIMAVTTAINMMLLVTKAGKVYGGDKYPTWKVQAIAWGTGVVLGLLVLCLMPLLRKKVLREREQAAKTVDEDSANAAKAPESEESSAADRPTSFWGKFMKKTLDRDIHQEVEKFEEVTTMYDRAEVFDPAAEDVFKYLQVFTACCDSLAHGANDVANAVGPLAAVAQVWKTGSFNRNSSVPKWVLAVGAVGIVVGLGTYGYNIMKASMKLSKITSSRGFCIELSAAMVVVVASNYGMPVSTTHCQMGAIAGVGCMEGARGVNWRVFAKMFAGWVMTLVVAGFLTAGLVSIGVYAPSAQMADQIEAYEDGLRLRSAVFQYAFNWEAAAAFADPASIIPPSYNATSGAYTFRTVPDHPADGVPSDKSYDQWSAELWADAGEWQKTASWEKAWSQALGYEAPDWSGQNASTITPRTAFALFDKVAQFAFSPNQQAEIAAVLEGEKVLCCDEIYKCCPRTCKYKKVNEDCEGKCELKKDDPECVDEGCSEDDMAKSSVSTASYCKIVDTSDDCPMTMDIDSKKNYIGPNYQSVPITAPPPEGDSDYGKPYTDWREANYDMSIKSCPPKV